MSDAILVEQRDSYRVITLNRPDRLNALDRPTHQLLMAALLAAEADPACRALLLTGAGRGFCAGADLSGRGSGVGDSKASGRDSGNSIEETWNPLARKLFRLRMPTICAVNGIAAGAGSSIALGCDIVIAAARPNSCRPSPASAWCPTVAAASTCPGWPARPAPAAWRCWPSRCRPKPHWPGA